MRFWLDMGVDGLRLDAIPYLIEREGTSCENLPETHAVLEQLRRETVADGWKVTFDPTGALGAWPPDPDLSVKPLGAAQGNTSSLIGDASVLKVYRGIEPGINPELEVGRFLTERTAFRNMPALMGSVEAIDEEGRHFALAALHAYVPNHGDGWTVAVDHIRRALDDWQGQPAEERPDASEIHANFLPMAERLGTRIGELHRALASEDADPAFAPEPMTGEDVATWKTRVRAECEATFRHLNEASDRLPRDHQRPAEVFLEQYGRRIVDREVRHELAGRPASVLVPLQGAANIAARGRPGEAVASAD